MLPGLLIVTGYKDINAQGINEKVIDGDGNVYETVVIGPQTWLSTNLRTTSLNDGTTIPLITDAKSWSLERSPAYCIYDNNASYSESYGALYNWYSVNTKKLCPDGFHVPSSGEWETLINFLGGEIIAGEKLREPGTAHWAIDTGTKNEAGFTAVPGGFRWGISGGFSSIQQFGYWWTSSADTKNDMDVKIIVLNENRGVSTGVLPKNSGYSVRCLKNPEKN